MSILDSVIEQAAKTAHEVNRAYCATLGDDSQKPWDETPENIKASVIDGVQAVVRGDVVEPGDSHANWLKFKEADGWTYGEKKDTEAKTHPSMVPFEELSPEEQHKDLLFMAVVFSFLN